MPTPHGPAEADPPPPLRLLLYGLQSPINVGAVLRVAETYGVAVDVWDPPGLFADSGTLRWISDFSCGAYARGAYRLLDAAPSPRAGHGRRIATCLRGRATSLPDFDFQPGDVVAIGNEYDGLPADYIAAADCRLHIPMPPGYTPKPPSLQPIDPTRPPMDPADGSPVLSAAMSAAIICYAAFARSDVNGRSS